MEFFTLQWQDDAVVMIDQRRLPNEEIYNTYRSPEEVAEAFVPQNAFAPPRQAPRGARRSARG